MRKHQKFWIFLCLLWALALCSCSAPEQPQEQPPEAVPETITIPCPAAETMPEPEPEPEPELWYPSAMDVTVNGVTLEHGSIVVDKTVCVSLQELAEALDTTWVWNSEAGEGGLLWQGKWIALRDDVAGCRYGGKWIRLQTPPTEYEGHVYVAARELCQGLELGVLHDRKQVHLYVTAAAGSWEIPSGYCVPVIMYHGVTDAVWGSVELFVSPADMEAQLRYLVENGFTPIWFEDLARIDEIEKPVILTFDDGYADNYHELYPLLQKYQVKATVFVVTGTTDYNPRNLTSEQIREMSASGLVSIQSHTVTHPYLAQLSPEEQQWELEQSRLTLTRLTGQIPYVICYPSGNYNETTLELAETCYRMGIDMNGGDYWTGADPYEVSRWYMARSHTLGAFADMVE